MRFIEFAVKTHHTNFSPSIVLLDCEDIVAFEQIIGNPRECKLITKQKNEYIVYGTYKTLTNRFFYAISKKHSIHEDDIVRPSIRVFHRPNLLEVDVAFFDPKQLKAFITGLIPDFDMELLPEYTREVFAKEKL